MFLALFLFNLIGYKCWFYYLQQKEKVSFEASLDKDNYDEKDLIVFKVPLSNPYQIDQSRFERVDGEINIRGVIYKYVKRKVENGQLILLCLPYYKKMKLAKALTEFSNHGNDLVPPGKKGGSGDAGKNNSPNEYEANTRWDDQDLSRQLPARQHKNFLLSPLSSCFIEFPGKPPELG